MNLEINIVDPSDIVGHKVDFFYVIFKTDNYNLMVEGKCKMDEIKGCVLDISMGGEIIKEFKKLFGEKELVHIYIL